MTEYENSESSCIDVHLLNLGSEQLPTSSRQRKPVVRLSRIKSNSTTARLCARLRYRPILGIHSQPHSCANSIASKLKQSMKSTSSLYAILALSVRRKRDGSVSRKLCVFEGIHEEIYESFGFEVLPVGPGTLLDRLEIKFSLS